MKKNNRSENSEKQGNKILKGIGFLSAVIGLVLGISQVSKLYNSYSEKKNKVNNLINDSHLRSSTGDYAGAWKNLEDAQIADPSSEKVSAEQTILAMQWIRNIRLSSARGETKFSDIVYKLLPVLYHSAGIKNGAEKADILAHIGYTNYLKFRDGQMDARIDENFKAALAEDADNVFAHAMYGFWLLFPANQNGNFNEAEKHFERALKSGREQKYVRYLHLVALNNSNHNYKNETKMFGVLNEMRKEKDTIEYETRDRLLSDAYSFEKTVLDSISSVLTPEDHLATFLYLSEGVNIIEHPMLRMAYARVIENAGDTAKALSMYQSMYAEKSLATFNRRNDIKNAIDRLSQK